MTSNDYFQFLLPVFKRQCDFLEKMGDKHGQGIFPKDDDIEAAIGHLASHLRGKDNEDGETHLIAALVRISKQEL